jgi:hypothetical protein
VGGRQKTAAGGACDSAAHPTVTFLTAGSRRQASASGRHEKLFFAISTDKSY